MVVWKVLSQSDSDLNTFHVIRNDKNIWHKNIQIYTKPTNALFKHVVTFM